MTAHTPSVRVWAILTGRAERIGLDLEVLAGSDGLDREITIPYIQKTGLAFAGYEEYLRPVRVLILGDSEVRYLERLSPEERTAVVHRALSRDIPCALIAGGSTPPAELVAEANRLALPLLRTSISVATSIGKLTALLEDRLAVREITHGVLLDILGLGVLIVGESGIGKSECALELVARGHRLVADDAVEVRRRAETVVIGRSPELTRHHMEIRGLGIINVKEMFGIASTRSSKRVELVVRFERWELGQQYDRLGFDKAHFEILGIIVPLVQIPVAPGRNLAILVEVAARTQLLRARGQRAPEQLAARLDRQLQQSTTDEDEVASEGRE